MTVNVFWKSIQRQSEREQDFILQSSSFDHLYYLHCTFNVLIYVDHKVVKTIIIFSCKTRKHSLNKTDLHGIRVYYWRLLNSEINKLTSFKFDMLNPSSICRTNALVI